MREGLAHSAPCEMLFLSYSSGIPGGRPWNCFSQSNAAADHTYPFSLSQGPAWPMAEKSRDKQLQGKARDQG